MSARFDWANGNIAHEMEAVVIEEMRLAGRIAHKAIVLAYLSGDEVKTLVATITERERQAFVGDIKECRRGLQNLCELMERVEIRLERKGTGHEH